MPPIINARNLSKRYGVRTLFQNLAMSVSEGDRIGLIGPNGSGKSTLLGILAGRIEPDAGERSTRKLARIGYVPQQSDFPSGRSVQSIVREALQLAGVPEGDHAALSAETLGKAGFSDLEADAGVLSGGWRKRLSIASALAIAPDVLLLDEPTNHLDLDGIRWLEDVIGSGRFASVVVSHDRYLLENAVTSLTELNPVYDGGMLRVAGRYSDFLEAREAYVEAQGRRTEALSNRVRTEIAWLRRGPKARATKAQARIDQAGAMMDELADLKSRQATSAASIDFSGTERRTRRLVELRSVGFTIADRSLFDRIDVAIGPGTRLGVVGPNGCGKTTLLRLIRGELEPTTGAVDRANHLRIVYFDQNRNLDPDRTLWRTLAPDSDAVVCQDRSIHVATWASRFLFSSDDLNQPVGRLSGGERARVLIAQLMLEPADILLLDEPTNDLDIPTLEILEDSLLEFRGALVLITHDRHMMDRVATSVLGIDGDGASGVFADTSQWDRWRRERAEANRSRNAATKPVVKAEPRTTKKKLGYLEAREFDGIENQIEEAESRLTVLQSSIADPAIAADSERLLALSGEIETAERDVERLYSRWEELHMKQL